MWLKNPQDTDNATQPKQALLVDIPAEPCPQSSSHADCDVLQTAPRLSTKDDFLENSLGSSDNTSQSSETPEAEPISPDTLSLSPASPLLSFFTENGGNWCMLGPNSLQAPRYQLKKTAGPQPQRLQAQLSLLL